MESSTVRICSAGDHLSTRVCHGQRRRRRCTAAVRTLEDVEADATKLVCASCQETISVRMSVSSDEQKSWLAQRLDT